MELIVIPNFGERISPRIDYSESLKLISVEDGNIIKKETIKILPHNNLERINLIIGLSPDVVICDGISNLVHDKLKEHKINVIAWIHGNIEDIIENYLQDNSLLRLKTKNKNKG